MSHSLADLINVARSGPIEAEASQRGVHLKGRVDRAGPCPRCGGRDRFAISLKKQVWICRGGDVIDLVRFSTTLTSNRPSICWRVMRLNKINRVAAR
jgi:phage/plasmid primase-like uncharacterized protein